MHTLNTLATKGDTQVKQGEYFRQNPDIVKIFDDLDKFRDFCRFEGYRFNERDLYSERSRSYQAYLDPVKARKERRERKQARYKKRRHS